MNKQDCERIGDFHEGLACATDNNGKFFHVNENNEPAYSEQYDEVWDFHEGLAYAEDDRGCFHIKTDGKPAYPESYDHVSDFHEGLAAAALECKCFHINHDGKPAYEERYDWVGYFEECLAPARRLNGKYFHINKNGKPAYEERYDDVCNFHDGRAKVRKGRKSFCIDTNGKKIGETMNGKDYDEIGDYHNGFTRAKHDGKWFHITPYDKPAYRQRYDKVGDFNEDRAAAKENGKWFHIKRDGKPAYKERYDCVGDFYDGVALVRDENGSCFSINKEGRIKVLKDSKQRGTCLKNAIEIINGERKNIYGNPENSFQTIADHWNDTIKQLIQNRINNQENLDNLLSAENVAQLLALFKHCRQLCGSGKEDNYTDQAGYVGLASDLYVKNKGDK